MRAAAGRKRQGCRSLARFPRAPLQERSHHAGKQRHDTESQQSHDERRDRERGDRHAHDPCATTIR